MRLVYERNGEQIAFPLDEGETYIGRKEYCDLHFPETSLSKRHARVVRRGRELWVYDAGSRNGTQVNGNLITEYQLKNGDVIQCGKLSFRVEGIPGPGAGPDEFEILEDSAPAAAVPRARAIRSADAPGLRTVSEVAGGVPVARAVASTDARASALDVLPQVRSGSMVEAAALARFRLVAGGEEQAWDLSGEPVTIGSKPENGIVLQGEGVSRHHAQVVLEEGQWLLKDLGSRNGIFVDGVRVDIHELHDGDEVQIGTARLRFERVKPAALTQVGDALGQLGFVQRFKQDRRLRLAASSGVTGLVLLVLAFGGGGGGQVVSAGDDLTWCEAGTSEMAAGDYKKAKETFRRALSQGLVNPARQDVPRTLAAIAALWERSDEPLTFRWSKAEELLAQAKAMSDLPATTVAWLDGQSGWVTANREAYDQLTRAEAVGAKAAEHAGAGRFEPAFTTYNQALAAYADVPGGSVFAERATSQRRIVRQEIFKLVLDEVQRQTKQSLPSWDEVLRLLERATPYADDAASRATLRDMTEECHTNRRDEAAYMRAVDIVQVRDVANYPKAIMSLKGVSPRSRIYPDAVAYLEWIEADRNVRNARRAYDQADERRAFLLLSEALKPESLGAEARSSVRQRREQWARVVRHFQAGMQHYHAGRLPEAKRELEEVLRLEPSKENRYNQLALTQLRFIAETSMLSLERKLRKGIDELNRGDYDAALQTFVEVKADANVKPRELVTIREAVASVATQQRLLQRAKFFVMNDRGEKFLWCYYALKVMQEWLPPDHPDRPEVKRFYEQVRQRLRTILQNHPDNR